MTRWLGRISIRARLLVVYSLLFLAGFGLIALLAGEQIASGARADYTQRLRNEITLIAQGATDQLVAYARGELDAGELAAALEPYEQQASGSLQFITMAGRDVGGGGGGPRDGFRDQLELETALRGQVVVAERKDEAGVSTFYTAAPVMVGDDLAGMLQMSVPADRLQTVVAERWLSIALLLAVVTLASVAAALILARSIIRPLEQVRDAARRLSKGDFASRAQVTGKDEIAEVAHAFNDMAAQVQSTIEEQRAFASNTSHELRTPLTSIRLRTEALRDEDTLDPEMKRRYVEEIDDEVARLTNLVQDLTLLSRLDAGRAELGRDEVDVGRFAANQAQQMKPLAAERGLTLTLHPPAQPVTVDAGLGHLDVAFRNLLDNAIKYTPAGGSVTWTITATDTHVRHVIQDNGRGIDAEHLDHVFERFYRGDKARSRETPGTGLGLSLVRTIVEFYGGTIRVESAGAGQGTTVTVLWPRAETGGA